MDSYISPRTKPLFRGVQVVQYLFGLLEVLLAFRFILRLMGANPAAAFTNFIYVATWPFVAPFFAVFNASRVEGSVLEWTTLLAMVVYALIEWGIIKLFFMSKDVSTPEAAAQLDAKEK